MINIIRDQGLVLRSFKFKESSLMLNIFTKKSGKIKLLAKGARRPKSVFGASLEPFTHLRLIFYHPEPREIYTLSETEICRSFPKIRISPRRIVAAEVVCEFLDKALPWEQTNFKLYQLALKTIELLENFKKLEELASITYSFLFLAVSLLGFRPHLNNCVLCGRKASNLFSINHGGLLCRRQEDSRSQPLPLSTLADLRKLYLDSVPRANLKNLGVLENIIKAYIQYYFEGIELKAINFFRNINLVAG